jgi:large subunit ribosomal protein L13
METTPKYTIDAKGRVLGRVASEAATSLMGKKEATYIPHAPMLVKVEILNADLLEISDKKKREKVYISYSGYPGGQKQQTMAQVIAKHGTPEVLRRAIYNMLPSNKLRNERMKNLSIKA